MGIGAAVGGLAMGGAALMNKGAVSQGANTMALGQIMAAQIQQQMFNNVNNAVQPTIQYGQNNMNALAPLIGTAPGTNPLTAPLTAQFQPTMAQLAATPGYQFTLQQGLNAAQNGYAAQGLGSSGNAVAGGAQYAAGLASQTYNQQLQNYLAQNLQTFNMLNTGVNQGLAGAGILGQAAGTASTNIGNSLASAGNAYGQGQIASTSAITNPLMSLGAASMTNPQFQNTLNTAGNGLSSFFGGIGQSVQNGLGSVNALGIFPSQW